MAKKKPKYAIKGGKLVIAKPKQTKHPQPKSHDYTDKAVADYIIKRRKQGKLTGFAKDQSERKIREVIKTTYYSQENEWQSKADTKARYKEVLNQVLKSEYVRSEAQRGKQNVFRNLERWGQVGEFQALGGQMWDQNNLYSVNDTTWVYYTDDGGSIIMSLVYNGDDSIAHFDMSYISEQEMNQYGPNEAEDSIVGTIWRYHYA